MEFLWSRPVFIALAVLGGLCAGLASLAKSRNAPPRRTRQLNIASYALMGASMLVFIVAGFNAGS